MATLPTDLTMVLATSLAGIATHLVFHFREPKSPYPVLLTAAVVPAVQLLIYKTPASLGLPSVAAVYLAYLASLTLSIIFYRISPFHPLAEYPGPLLYKITKLTGMWVSWTGRQHLINKRLHDKYGPFVRVGPNEISVVDVDAVSSVLGAGGVPKGRYYDARQDPNAPSNLIVLRGEPHANRRRLWNRGMSSDSLKEYETMIANRLAQLNERLEDCSGSVDLTSWINYFTFDVMGDMAFGGGFHMISESDKGGFWTVIERFAVTASVVSHVPWASALAQKIPAVARDLQSLRKLGIERATARIQAGPRQKDLWYHLSDDAGLEKVQPLVRDVVADGALAILAGADTTASALASLFYFLLCNPDCYARVQRELDSVYPGGADPMDTSKHPELIYLTACLNETLRLQPPVPTSGPREVPRGTGGAMVCGRFVPESTQIYVPPYSLHRDSRYFPHAPNQFIPERWLNEHEKQNSAAFIPFSFGPANCVGRLLARREMLMFASAVLHKHRLALAAGFNREAWPSTLHDHFVSTRGPLMVVLTSRDHSRS